MLILLSFQGKSSYFAFPYFIVKYYCNAHGCLITFVQFPFQDCVSLVQKELLADERMVERLFQEHGMCSRGRNILYYKQSAGLEILRASQQLLLSPR